MSNLLRVPTSVWTIGLALFFSVFMTDCHVASPSKVESPVEVVSLSEPEPKAENKLTARIFIDDKFSPIERSLVEEGLSEWERATNGAIRFIVMDREEWNSDQPVLNIPQPDPETHFTICSKDIYIIRAFSKDALVKSIEDEIKESSGKAEFNLAGFANPSCKMKFFLIVADTIGSADHFVAVTIHEMGHLLGMQHLQIADETAMFPSLDHGTSCLTALDMGQFSKIWKVNSKLLRPCKV